MAAPLDMRLLRQEAEVYRTLCWAPSTRRAYSVHRRCYLRFCTSAGISPVPASTDTLCLYATFLARRLKYKSVCQYLNIVRILHAEWNLPNPMLKNFHLHATLQGIRRQHGDVTVRKTPITPQMLLHLLRNLNLSIPEEAAVWAAALLMFYSLLRRSNVLLSSAGAFDPSRHLRRCDISFNKEGASIKVRWTKTIQFRQRELCIPLCRLPGHPLCPTTALFLALNNTHTAAQAGPAIVVPKDGSFIPLTTARFLTLIRQRLAGVCDPSTIAGHSFRRGGASWAYQAGVPVDTIRQLGDWASNAYMSYAVCDTNSLHEAERLMCLSLPQG